MKHYVHYDEVYKEWVILVIGDGPECAKLVNKKYGLTVDVDGDPGGRCSDYNGYHVIWMPKFKHDSVHLSMLVHELTHCALDVFNNTGVEQMNANNSEPFCYYLESLTRVFLEKIKGKKDK